MPWIEQVLQVSSDGGDGTFEFAIFFAPATVTALSTRRAALRWAHGLRTRQKEW